MWVILQTRIASLNLLLLYLNNGATRFLGSCLSPTDPSVHFFSFFLIDFFSSYCIGIFCLSFINEEKLMHRELSR